VIKGGVAVHIISFAINKILIVRDAIVGFERNSVFVGVQAPVPLTI
jgi:hypothetical protein